MPRFTAPNPVSRTLKTLKTLGRQVGTGIAMIKGELMESLF